MPHTDQADAPDDRQRQATGALPQLILLLGRNQHILACRFLRDQRQRIVARQIDQPHWARHVDPVAGGNQGLGRLGQLVQKVEQLLVVDRLQVIENQQRALLA